MLDGDLGDDDGDRAALGRVIVINKLRPDQQDEIVKMVSTGIEIRCRRGTAFQCPSGDSVPDFG
jgi:hypothetical protein